MNAYCDRQSVDFNSIAFLFDGRRLRAEQTPDEVREYDIPSLLYLYQIYFDNSCVTFMFYGMEICLVSVGDGRWR